MLELNFNIALWCRFQTLGPAHLWNSWRHIFGQTGFVKCDDSTGAESDHLGEEDF